MRKPPSLRNNNGTLQVRVRIDGRAAFINRLGRWDDSVLLPGHRRSVSISGVTISRGALIHPCWRTNRL